MIHIIRREYTSKISFKIISIFLLLHSIHLKTLLFYNFTLAYYKGINAQCPEQCLLNQNLTFFKKNLSKSATKVFPFSHCHFSWPFHCHVVL